mgnify:CR=1 FL=1
MKFRILRPALADGVAQVSKAVSQKTTIPILTGIKIKVDDEGIELTGSNSDITIQVRIPRFVEDQEQVSVDQPGEIVLPGRVFSEIIRKLPDDEVEFTVNGRWITKIRSGQAQFQLNGLDASEYPRLPLLEEDQVFSLPSDLLQSMIMQTHFATSASETRGVLRGVLWQLEKGKLRFVATDSHRLSRREAEVESPEELVLNNVIVPGKSMSELAKLLSDYKGLVDVIVTENQILIRVEHLLFFSRLLNGTYPDTDRVIPRGGKTEIITSTRTLLESVDRASLISRDDRDNVIKCIVNGDNRLEITSAAQDIGRATEEVTAEVSGETMEISFNAHYMMEALRAIDSEQIRILMTGTMTPFLIQPVGDESVLHLIVPVRTN